MSTSEPSAPSTSRDRDRLITIALVSALVAVGVSPSLGFPAWVATPIVLVLGVAVTLRVVMLSDRLLSKVEDAELDQLRAIWGAIAPAGDQRVTPRDVGTLVDLIREDHAGLQSRAAQLASIIDAVEIAILATDAAGRVILANPAAQQLIGVSGPLVGRGIDDAFTHPDLVAIATSARRGVSRASRIRLPRPGSVLLIDVSAVPLQTITPRVPSGEGRPARSGVVLALRDVTELATAVALKTDFVANASHELRTPLASIRAAVETIQEFAGDDPEARSRFLGTIATSVARLEELCRDLLDLSRLESPDIPVERRAVHLDELASELTQIFDPVLRERDLTLTFEIAPDVLTVQSDPRLLSLIIKNLIENATKFAYEGSEIRVVCAVSPRDPDDTSTARTGKPGLTIDVIDRGIGIPISLQHRIFERFFQVDSARAGATDRRGTGLGLAIVKHACRALGGRIIVQSIWKQGTTMRVELPACVELSATPADSPAS